MKRGLPFPPPCRAFTLVELLVVLALIAGLLVFLIGGLGGGGRAASLQAGQAIVVNLVTAARARAMATGQSTRVLVHFDTRGTQPSTRFLRYLAVQTQIAGTWQWVGDAYLPDGVYFVPGHFDPLPAGLIPLGDSAAWVRSNGAALRSSVMQSNMIVSETLNSAAAEQWMGFSLAASGMTGQAGDIVLALGNPRSPGSFAEGESPVELENPESVRGLVLSAYGATALVEDRTSF